MLKFLSSIFLATLALFSGVSNHSASFFSHIVSPQTSSHQVRLTQSQLLAMASDTYANGNLPLGDNKYVTVAPKKGYIYLCHVQTDSNVGGALKAGSWIHGSTWNIHEKIVVQGNIPWPSAMFSNTVTGDTRVLAGNDLPSHTTGIFPIQSSDPAFPYDKNPNAIKSQSFTDTLPLNPTYSDTPYCMGGEAGIMLTGVALFSGFDAQLRDAAAYEVQDSCNGHPQVSGEYHYHSLSSCITDVSETNVIGYALDGFPITGPKVAPDKYLTTDDLDECHGITSDVMLNGKMITTYHYVMTEDFPYSVSCFRGKPARQQVIQGNSQENGVGQGSGMPQGGQGGSRTNQTPQPPQEASTVCVGKSVGTSCSFTAPRGNVTGSCQTPPGKTAEICVPSSSEQHQGRSLTP